jgi:hypothetical protein
MNAPDLGTPSPDFNHELTEVDGVYHIRPSVSLATRDREGFWRYALMFAILLVPLISTLAFIDEVEWMLVVAGTWIGLTVLAALWIKFRPMPKRHPLILYPEGKIEYRGRVVRSAGRVAVLRAYAKVYGGDDADTLHVECIDAQGRAVELPRRFFADCHRSEIVAVVPVMARLLGAPLKNELGFPAQPAYTRKSKRGVKKKKDAPRGK